MKNTFNNKNISLGKWIWHSYIRTALIPLIIVELIFICTYFVSNSWSQEKTITFLKDQAKSQLNQIAKQKADSINHQLSCITNSADFFSKEIGQALSSPASLQYIDYNRLTYSKDGAYYTKENSNDGAAIFYSGIVPLKEKQHEKVAKVLTKEELMKNIKKTESLADSLYFNSFDSLNIIYPYFNVLSYHTPLTDVQNYNFYYEADAEHNPERKVKWTDVYLDPVSNNLITSAICPVYNNNFLEGVVGINVTVNTITNQILTMDIPWDGYSLLVGKDGDILTFQDKSKSDWDLNELTMNSYGQVLSKNDFNSDKFNLYKNSKFTSLINEVHNNETGFSNFKLKGDTKAISWSTISDTGWKLLIIVPEKNIYSKVDVLKSQLIRMGIIIALGLILSYFIYFLILSKKAKTINGIVADSFSEINDIVEKISEGDYNPKMPILNISELKSISVHLIEMGKRLGDTNKNLLNTQSELREKEIDLKALVNSINDIILEIDSNGTITNLWSRTHHDLYQLYMQGDFKSIYDLLDNTVAEIAREKICYVLETRDTDILEFNIESNSGLKWFQASISPRLNDLNNVVVSSRDITEQKKMARSIIAAKEEAEKASKAKSEFLSSMSHELRTPLNAILGFSQILELDTESPLTKSQGQSVKEILKAGNHLLELINEVLDLAKIEAGKLSISIEPVQIKPIMEETISILKPFADKHGIKITSPYIENDDEFVYADHTRLKQILLNLLSNAIKYNKPDGEVVFYHDRIGDKYRFHIIDTGIGLCDSDLDLIFKPFHRLNQINNSIEGTGIGLAVAKQLVELMHGEIFVTSKKSVGSHFWFELPYVEFGLKEISESSIPNRNKNSFDADKLYKILYVEDNPANLRLVERILNKIDNLNMISATSGELCIDLAIAHKPDIILLDINLPGMDGYEVFKRLKLIEETANIPIIAVSAHAMPKDIEKCLSIGFANYITKPINIPNFIETVSRILNVIN